MNKLNKQIQNENLALLLIIIALIPCTDYGNKLTFNGTEVNYKDGITKEQTTKFGNYLIKEGFATGDTTVRKHIENIYRKIASS